MDKSLAPIALQEPLIIARLRAAFTASIFTIDRVPIAMTIREFQLVSQRAPFIGLAWNGMRPDAQARDVTGVMQWRLFLIYRATSGLEARFKGDLKGLGLDAMIDVAAALLHGFRNEVGMTALTGAAPIVADGFADDAVVMAQIDFNFSFATNTCELDVESGDDLLSMGVTWALSGAPEGSPEPTEEISLGA